MTWCSWFFLTLYDVFRFLKNIFKISTKKRPEESVANPRKLKKVPFYSHIPANQVQVYQSYIDRALALSPTLEFEENDPRLHKLLAEAVNNDSLSEFDFELMRLQYVYADKHFRTKHRSGWVERVINRKDIDFFPDPWTIVSAVFAEGKAGARAYYEINSKAWTSTL